MEGKRFAEAEALQMFFDNVLDAILIGIVVSFEVDRKSRRRGHQVANGLRQRHLAVGAVVGQFDRKAVRPVAAQLTQVGDGVLGRDFSA